MKDIHASNSFEGDICSSPKMYQHVMFHATWKMILPVGVASWTQIGSKLTEKHQKQKNHKKSLKFPKNTWKTLSWLCFEDFVVNSAKIIPAILPKCLAVFSSWGIPPLKS